MSILVGEGQVYIGESENVYVRLTQQLRDREFWNVAVVFTSKDDNLTKSHIRYLEAKAIGDGRYAERYEIENDSVMQLPSLPRADRDSMEEFFQNLRVLLGTLGHRVLEPLIAARPVEQDDVGVDAFSDSFTFESSSFSAQGVQTDEGFIVLRGSTIAKDVSGSITHTLSRLREQAVQEGKIRTKVEDGGLFLTEDIFFSSPSYAASFVAGNSRNGRISWKDNDGLTLKELEEQTIIENGDSGSEVVG